MNKIIIVALALFVSCSGAKPFKVQSNKKLQLHIYNETVKELCFPLPNLYHKVGYEIPKSDFRFTQDTVYISVNALYIPVEGLFGTESSESVVYTFSKNVGCATLYPHEQFTEQHLFLAEYLSQKVLVLTDSTRIAIGHIQRKRGKLIAKFKVKGQI